MFLYYIRNITNALAFDYTGEILVRGHGLRPVGYGDVISGKQACRMRFMRLRPQD